MRGYTEADAHDYDETRGGVDRARAAAAAVLSLVPPTGRCLDVAGGTGIVSSELAAAGLDVVVTDLSSAMLVRAADRLPGRCVQADAARLPVGDATVDVVVAIWFLHLLDVVVADAVLAEAARVVRPGGHVVVTVDKRAAHDASVSVPSDARERVAAALADHGLEESGDATFSGRSRWGSSTGGDPVFTVVAFRRT